MEGSPSRNDWLSTSVNQDLERSKLGDSDERTIYEVQQGQDVIDATGLCSIRMVDDGILNQRLVSLARQREGLQQMEIELGAQMIAKSEIMAMRSSFDARLKEQSSVTTKLQEQLREREQTMNGLERKIEEKERELHAVRLDNEAAWAKEDLLREQNKEIVNFRRERDGIEAERTHHIKQLHELQELFQDKERQFQELQEQHKVAQETIIYKDEQIRDAQVWIARVQEIDGLQSSTLQAELRERTEQYNQLWLGCQRQFVEMERLHIHTIQQLRLQLESTITQSASSDGSQIIPNNGIHAEVNGGGAVNDTSVNIPNGNSETGNASKQTNHVPDLRINPPSILGMHSYLPAGQVTAMHSYVMHQQGANHSVASDVPQSHVGHFHSIPAMASYHQWQNQQALSENPPMSSQSQYSLSHNEENSSRSESNYGYELSINEPGLRSDYLNARMSQGLDPSSQMSSTEQAVQTLESVQREYLSNHETQHSLQQISSQFHEALRLEPLNHSSEIKDNDAFNAAVSGSEQRDVIAEHISSTSSSSPSDTSNYTGHSAEAAVDDTADAVISEKNVSAGQSNSLSSEKILNTALLDERALLACIVRTIPPGGKINISSTLPNRLDKMLSPLHWHDYKKYGKLDDFLSSHPELFLIEKDFIQLREGAQGLIAATAAVAKVAAAVASSSPYSSFFPSVSVTPMANASSRAKKFQLLEPKPASSHSSAIQSQHHNGSGFPVSGGYSLEKISRHSDNYVERNSSEIRPGQPIMVPTDNGAHSDRYGLRNLQNQGPIHSRTSDSFAAKQPSRTSSSQMPSRR